MKLNMASTKRHSEEMANGATHSAQQMEKAKASVKAGVPKRVRRLKWNEVVCRGDFVANEHQGFKPWEGPSGFRADAFVKPIYRRDRSRLAATKERE
ncbi:MAG: hypothetical protein HZA90_19970 [Verrucomicrobia bacterium]|nr:hypothetical protein [Verrucomicrobiota bacterium]